MSNATQQTITFNNPFGASGSRRLESRNPFGGPSKLTPEEIDAKRQAALTQLDQQLAQRQQEREAMQPAAEPTTSELDAAFQRTADNQPAPDKPAAWGDDDAARKNFFASYNALCDTHAVPRDQRDPIRKAVLKRLCGSDSLKGFDRLTPGELLTQLKAEIEPLYPLEMADKPAPENKPAKAPASPATQPGATVTPEAPENATAGKSDGKPALSLPPIPKPEYCGIKTFTGIPIEEVTERANARYDLHAYGKVEYKPQWTDLDPVYVRRRLEELFGPHGFGWSIIPHPAMGRHFFEEIEGSKKPFRVVYEMYVLRYRIKLPDGGWDFVETSPQSDSFSGTDRDEAYKSAFTSIMKTLLRSIGGIDHLLLDEYGHEEAKRDLQRRAS